MKNRLAPWLAALAGSFLILLSNGCQDRQESHGSRSVISLVDDLGHSVSLSAPARRVISLAPSITETLYAIGADSTIAGVTNFCNYPPAALSKTRVGGIIDPNVELIVNLHPDLILMSVEGNRKEDYERFQRLHIPVFVTNPRSIEGVLKSIRDLGLLTGHEHQADSLVARLSAKRAKVDSVTSLSSKPHVLMLVSLHPLVSVTERTFIGRILQEAGGSNIASDALGAYPLLSREEIVARNPEVIICTTDAAKSVEEITNAYPEWKDVQAVRTHHVYLVDADILTRPGPRIIDALDTLAYLLHQ